MDKKYTFSTQVLWEYLIDRLIVREACREFCQSLESWYYRAWRTRCTGNDAGKLNVIRKSLPLTYFWAAPVCKWYLQFHWPAALQSPWSRAIYLLPQRCEPGWVLRGFSHHCESPSLHCYIHGLTVLTRCSVFSSEQGSWKLNFTYNVLPQYVPQDTAKLIELQGGNEKFISRLDFIFNQVRFYEL